ncbi:MAG: threonine synthase [Cenarchaeum sp. SB0665_bin_23]|nr:threonine synthase [Cenarchaeum sp. SB0667_bin_13]MXY61314.1 threonine synthase [Cenarchaeum sp. SB0665_bin_23]MXZ93676.1 threonine synthase [Cenarchaeum sp. SB0666_bin_15]MYB46510.1 threonine synthase [Cenarchaeum sp. SB0662_bin_33]MYC80397.1 threonine synthase [Cenarchaeum sp. SB0661_bin_35]MYD59036.1 threonine synthase [Cenarchaeum sp. SB0678_bin_8]MYG32790.1 threonine synthase [Cenarchaeum sp. SB0677_bin_16]MYI52241.1 threonine synthase [Cenarchaeum sp. SB0673_bin_9]MYJ27400.1 threon
MSVRSLKCRECGREYDMQFRYICDECFGPLDVSYDIPTLSPDVFANREQTYWRYSELLPIQDKSNIVSIGAGMTPLIRAERLGEKLGLRNLYIKNDSVNPTFSFKDRPAGVAISKARELGLKAVGCASTGNLASATAAHAAKANLPCYIFAPSDIEMAKIVQALSYGGNFMAVKGTYDDANTIAAQIGDRRRIGVVNINMRSYYVEGSKTLAFEVAEQLDWQMPDHLIIPVGSGAMLNAICKGFEELEAASLIDDASRMRPHAAQPHGCAPVVDAFHGTGIINPVYKPDTIAKSLAIGDPGDGRYVLKRLKQYGGSAGECTNDEILDGLILLAKTEGIFTEPAGGVAVAVLHKMVKDGRISPDETTICYITGNGLKATDTVMSVLPKPQVRHPDVTEIAAAIK